MPRPENLGRDFKPTDPRVAEFVEWIQTNDKHTWFDYLVIKGLHAHLGKYMGDSPFPRGTDIDTRICQLIHRFWPELSTIENINFRWAVMGYINVNHLVKKTFPDYQEP